jgi:D-3-phosphoglycerate dehydrogenase
LFRLSIRFSSRVQRVRLKILLTTTSFQDTPGPHQVLLAGAGYEISRERGPLDERRMLELAGSFDAFLCGDDVISRTVMERSLPRLKVISKYGVGLDRIDLKAAADLKIPVLFTPGVNHTAVAEHTFALLLAALRHIVPEANAVAQGAWTRITGTELFGKNLAIIGLGRIGREVAIRARGFGVSLTGFGHHWDEAFAQTHGLRRVADLDSLLEGADIVTLHTQLTPRTRHLLNRENLQKLRPGAVIVNCARGELIERAALVEALRSNHLLAYAADTLDEEPPAADHPLLGLPNVILTPHIGSRTFESVGRQGVCAVENLLLFFAGKKPHAQASAA